MGSWQLILLPYIEKKNLFDIYVDCGAAEKFRTGGARYNDGKNLPVTRTQIPTYTCPSDTKSADVNVISGITFHNYVACYGNTTRGRLTPVGFMANGTTQNVFGGGAFIEYINENTGGWANYYSWISHTNDFLKHMRQAQITDGLSNTLAMAETVQGKGGDLHGFGWWGGGAHFETLLTPNSPLPDRVEQSCTPAVRLNPPCVNRVV